MCSRRPRPHDGASRSSLMKRWIPSMPRSWFRAMSSVSGSDTGNALRGYEVGRLARARGAYVVFGGIHATLYPGRGPGARWRTRRGPRGRRSHLGDRHRRLCGRTPRTLANRKSVASSSRPVQSLPRRSICQSIRTVRGARTVLVLLVWRTNRQAPSRRARPIIREAVELRRRRVESSLADDELLSHDAGRPGPGRAPERPVAPAPAAKPPRQPLRPDEQEARPPTTWCLRPGYTIEAAEIRRP